MKSSKTAVSRMQAEARTTFGEALRLDEPMRNQTLFRIGGPADLFVRSTDLDLLRTALAFASRYNLPCRIIGAGSNLLVPDSGVRGLIVRVDIRTSSVEETRLTAGAGLLLPEVAQLALKHTLSGLEFCVGIPGTIGGALVMNAGCHGCEIGPLVEQVDVVDADGTIRTLGRANCSFSYRSSNLPGPALAIARAVFQLEPGEQGDIERRMGEHRAWRAEAQPHGRPNAGSVFKNPPGDAAGRLIDAAGCKGLRVGGAEVSTVHANFIVNRGGASYADVQALIGTIRERVHATSGITLELELADLGNTANPSVS